MSEIVAPGTELSDEYLDRPLLVFKAGIRGSLAEGSLRGLAQQYRACYRSGRALDTSQANRTLLEEARYLLGEGSDVILDHTLNRPTKRAPYLEMAREVGALSIVLDVWAPYEVVRQRLQQRIDEGSIARVRSARLLIQSDRQSLVPPEVDEGMDYIFEIDGHPPEMLGDQFAYYLQESGLEARYEPPVV